MGIVKFNPTIVNSVFDDFFRGFPARTTTPGYLPPVNVRETDDNFELELIVPGFTKEDFEIKVDDGILSITVQKEKEQAETKDGYTRREYRARNFTRRFTLPEAADDTAINAAYHNGILTLTLPKKEEAKPQPARLIEIAG